MSDIENMNKHTFSPPEKVVLILIAIAAILTVTFTLHPLQIAKHPETLAQQTVDAIDKATLDIIVNESPEGSLSSLYKLNSKELFDPSEGEQQSENLGELYKKYLGYSEKPCENEKQCGECAKYSYSFFLKNGVCIGITTGMPEEDVATIFPSEEKPTPMRPRFGVIFFDTNGANTPNLAGKDRFLLPLEEDGIEEAAN